MNIGETTVFFTSKEVRSSLSAKVTVDTLSINVELSQCIL